MKTFIHQITPDSEEEKKKLRYHRDSAQCGWCWL